MQIFDTVPDPLSAQEEIQLANFMMFLKGPVLIRFVYKNYKGKTSERTVSVSHLWYGTSEYHPEPGLMLHGYDIDKSGTRDFRMSDIVPGTYGAVR